MSSCFITAYRSDLFEELTEQKEFKDIAEFSTRPPELYGFVFPGRHSGLFGHFFELSAIAGGALLDKELSPLFGSEAGEWVGLLRDLYNSLP